MVGPFDLPAAELALQIVYREESLAKSEFETIHSHLKDSKYNPHASSYITVRSKVDSGVVFLAFRGTQDLADMIADFNCQPREIDDIEPSFYVHGGIYETAKQSMKVILPCLNEAHATNPITDLVFTGHSLGGACAMAARLFTLQMKERGLLFAPKCHIVSFGAPLLFSVQMSPDKLEDWKVREKAILASCTNKYLQIIRSESRCYVNENDLVPRILGKKKKVERPDQKTTWEVFLEENVLKGLSAASVELLPGASAGAAGVAGTGAIVLSPTMGMAVLSTVFVPIIAIPGLLLSVPMMATTKALPPASRTVEGKPPPPSDLEIKYEQFAYNAISWAVLMSKGHKLLESEQLSGYFPIGTFVFLRGGHEAVRAETASELAQLEEGLDVPHGHGVQRCIGDHSSRLYMNKMWALASATPAPSGANATPPPSVAN